MRALILILLALGIAFAIVGFVVEGLLWLAIVGIVLFVGTVLFALIRRVSASRS